jgi:hypothetical protein
MKAFVVTEPKVQDEVYPKSDPTIVSKVPPDVGPTAGFMETILLPGT